MKLVSRSLYSFAKIGFIGLGNMGLPMAANLASKGHEVFGFDVEPSREADARKHHITFRSEVRQVAKDANIFVTMLPNSEHSKSVC
jgi:3-hydroxyisobutyrate dehydrogenase